MVNNSVVHYWILLFPDSHSPIGGVKQVHRFAECVNKLGRNCTIVQDDSSFHPGWFASDVPTISRDEWYELVKGKKLSPHFNCVVIPESFIVELREQINNYLPVVIFCQNASYCFGVDKSHLFKPRHILSLYRHPNVVQVLCVSRNDLHVLTSLFGLQRHNVSLIVNGLEPDDCKPGLFKKKQVVCLIRKNPIDVSAVAAFLSDQEWFTGWKLLVLGKLSHAEVMQSFRDSPIYLSFGHPEGFGLPVAEAMASCCAVVGYSGLGGRELFAIGNHHRTATEVSVGDWPGFIHSIQDFCAELDSSPDDLLLRMLRVSKIVRSNYSMSAMQNSVCEALEKIEAVLAT